MGDVSYVSRHIGNGTDLQEFADHQPLLLAVHARGREGEEDIAERLMKRLRLSPGKAVAMKRAALCRKFAHWPAFCCESR